MTKKKLEAAAPAKRLRGFAAMTPERIREIASLGGKTVHLKGTAHEFTAETGRAAGLKRHHKGE